jgi:hypothetical protein
MDPITEMHKAIDAKKETTFKWGSHDCCMFAADVVQAMTGEDWASEFRGKYSTKDGAIEALQTIGKGSLYHTIRGKFGNPKPLAQAKRGWLMGKKTGDWLALGICTGTHTLFAHKKGWNEVKTLECDYAWEIK